MYSTYLGSQDQLSISYGNAVVLDGVGNAYFTGSTAQGGFQTTPGALNTCSVTNGCPYVIKLSTTGGEVFVAMPPFATAIAVDAQGAAYLAGSGSSSSFPGNPPGARRTGTSGMGASVVKLSPNGSSLIWAAVVGGSGSDGADAIALGPGNVVYFAGTTTSPDLPVTTGAAQGTYKGSTDGFVASVSADGSTFGFVTYLGGSGSDTLTSLVAGANGPIVAGNTYSLDFPVANAIQPAFPGPAHALWKSTDAGASFTPADIGLPLIYSPTTVLPDPSAAGVIVLSTGVGVYRSTDDGGSWSEVQPYSDSAARSLSNPSVLYTVGSNGGCDVYKSTNGGQTWTIACGQDLGAEEDVVGISPTDPNTVLLVNQNWEYLSANGFGSFQQIALPSGVYAFSSASIMASPDGSMYLTTGNWGGGLYKSADVGLIWTETGPAFSTGFLEFAIAPSSPSTLYISYAYGPASGSVYKSTDAGATWNQIATGAGVNYLAVDPTNPQTVYGASNSRVFVSSDGGVTWAPTGGNVDTNSIDGIAINPANGEIYLTSSIQQTGFLAELSADGTTLNWSTYFGAYAQLTMGGLAMAPAGNVWVAGSVGSGSLPITPDARNGNTAANGAAFLASIADTTASCSYTINPAAQYSYSAGKLVFAVTAPNGCAWTASPSDTWIHPVRGSGTGSGTIPVDVDANTTGSTRIGTVTVNGQVYTITQPPPSCTYQLSSSTVTSAGGTVTITVTAPPGCPWDVELENGDPATVTSSTTGTGNGTVTISIPPDGGVQNNYYSVLVGGQSVSISQPGQCAYTLAPLTLPATAGSGAMTVTTNLPGCYWSIESPYLIPWLSAYGTGYGSGTFGYSVRANMTGAPRVEQLSVNSNEVAVTQSAVPVLGTNALVVGNAGGTFSVVLADASAWTATANDTFLHVGPGSASGTGNAVVVFTCDPFTGTGSRTGTLTIAGQTVTVTQAGTNYIGPYGTNSPTTLVSSGLNGPSGVAVDGSGNVYVADAGDNAVQKWTASTQQMAPLVASGLSVPAGVAADASGNVYIADTGNNAVKEWWAEGQSVSTLVSAGLNGPRGVAPDSSGNVYIADTLNNAIEEWKIETYQVSPLVSAGLYSPSGVVVDVTGNVYIADKGNNAIKEWSASTQQVTTLVSSGLTSPNGVAVDGSGNLYIADTGDTALKEWSAATQQLTTLASSGQLFGLMGAAVDGSGNVYIANPFYNTINEIPYAFVGPASITEPASAGTDSLLPVLPSTAPLTGVYAPTSDSSWLTIGTVANGIISFSFTANTSISRVAHITVLGQQITVTQSGVPPQQPAITSITPNPVPLNQVTVLTVNGSNFQSGFTASVTIGSTTYPLSPGALGFVSSSQVQIWVEMGGTLAYLATLNITNPGGLTASQAFAVGGLQPAITSIAPNPVPLNQATTLTVNGSNFQNWFTASVTIGSTTYPLSPGALSFVSSSQVQIWVEMGGASAYSATLNITNPGGLTASQAFAVGGLQPAITSITPNPVLLNQATTLTVNGSNFQSGFTASVTIGGTTYPLSPGALGFVSSSQVQVWVEMGGTSAYTATLNITNPGGLTASQTFPVAASGGVQPSIASIAPNPVLLNQATTLTVNGSNFQSGFTASVSIGGTTYPLSPGALGFVSSSQVQVWVEMGGTSAYTATLNITNPGGLTASQTFPVASSGGVQPAITSIAPNPVPLNTATTLTVSGSNFQSGFTASVTIGGVTYPLSAAGLGFVSSSEVQIWVEMGGTSAYTATLNITNPGGLAASQSFPVS